MHRERQASTLEETSINDLVRTGDGGWLLLTNSGELIQRLSPAIQEQEVKERETLSNDIKLMTASPDGKYTAFVKGNGVFAGRYNKQDNVWQSPPKGKEPWLGSNRPQQIGIDNQGTVYVLVEDPSTNTLTVRYASTISSGDSFEYPKDCVQLIDRIGDPYAKLSIGSNFFVASRKSGGLAAAGGNENGQLLVPDGAFTKVLVVKDTVYGVRTNGTVVSGGKGGG